MREFRIHFGHGNAARRSFLVSFSMLALMQPACATAQPVVVGPDGHWLEFNGKKALLIGDSVTQGWMELGANFNQNAYVDALASRGINVLMLWSYIGITDQVGDARIGYDAPEIWPWARAGNTFDLGSSNGVYFDRLRALVQYAASKRAALAARACRLGMRCRRASGEPGGGKARSARSASIVTSTR